MKLMEFIRIRCLCQLGRLNCLRGLKPEQVAAEL